MSVKGVVLLVVLFSLVLSLNLSIAAEVEEKTLVLGNIYGEDFSEHVSGVYIWAICQDNEETAITQFINDSYFALLFDSTLCPENSEISIGAYKPKYEFAGAGGLVHPCGDEGETCDSFIENSNFSIRNFATVNINLHIQPEVAGITYQNGGPLVKINRTKIQEVPVTETKPVQIPQTPKSEPIQTPAVTNEEPQNVEYNDVIPAEKSGLKGITGAFLASGASSWVALVVILVAALVVFLLVKKGKSQSASLPSLSTNHSNVNGMALYY